MLDEVIILSFFCQAICLTFLKLIFHHFWLTFLSSKRKMDNTVLLIFCLPHFEKKLPFFIKKQHLKALIVVFGAMNHFLKRPNFL